MTTLFRHAAETGALLHQQAGDHACGFAGSDCVLEYVAANTCLTGPAIHPCPQLAARTRAAASARISVVVIVAVAATLLAATIVVLALLYARQRRRWRDEQSQSALGSGCSKALGEVGDFDSVNDTVGVKT